ncbi:MAG TPA: glycosyltransferase family 39 protein [Roseiflexaceae bacterium]|nr:glycosyltransferase family 39 protein [Roseiflexaceae bacterium]
MSATSTLRIPAAATLGRALARFAGIVLVVAGQWLILNPSELLALPFTAAVEDLLRLGVVNLNNVIMGLAITLLGGILFGAGGAALLPAAPEAERETPRPDWSTLLRDRRLALGLAGLLAGALAIFTLLLYGVTRPEADQTPWLGWLWLAALALLLLALLLADRRAGARLSPDLGWPDALLSGGLLAAGMAIGTYQLATLPSSIIGDEGMFWQTARAIDQGEQQHTIFGLGAYSYPVLSNYYQAAVLRLFGHSLWSWRLSSVIAAVLAVVPTYLLARELFGRRVAALAGLAMVALPYFIAFERMGYNNSQAILPVALSLYLLYAGLRRNSLLYMGLGGIAGGLGFYTYTAGRLAAVVAVLTLGVLLAARLLRRWVGFGPQRLGGVLLLTAAFGLGGVLTALPHLAYANTHYPHLLRYKMLESLLPNSFYASSLFSEDELYRDYAPITIDDQTFFYRPDLYARLLGRGVVRTMLVFHYKGIIYEHFISGPLAGPSVASLYVLGLALLLARPKRPGHLLLLLWFGAGLVLLSMINTFPPRYQHTVPIIPALAIMLGLGIAALADTLAQEFSGRARTLIGGSLTAALVAAMLVSNMREYFVDVQEAYPPPAAQIIGLAGLELREPRRLVYVVSDPQEGTALPWLLEQFPNKALYHTVTRDDLASGTFQLEPQQPYTVFFRERDRDVVEPFLAQRLGHPVTPKLHFTPLGDVELAEVSFGDR